MLEFDRAGLPVVQIWARSNVTVLVDQLHTLGITPTLATPAFRLVEAHIDIDQLTQVAALPEVLSVTPVYRPESHSGSVQSQGDAVLRVDLVRLASFDGAPLKEVGLTKAEIRELSAQLGLPTADKPQMACLSSRIPHGEEVTTDKLSMIERAENFLRDLGFHDVRVRHHELGAKFTVHSPKPVTRNQSLETPSAKSDTLALARIEVGSTEMNKLFSGDTTARVTAELHKIGYAHVTLDLHGYRRSGMIETRPALDAGKEIKSGNG